MPKFKNSYATFWVIFKQCANPQIAWLWNYDFWPLWMKMQRTHAHGEKTGFWEASSLKSQKKGNWKNVITRTCELREGKLLFLSSWKICRFSRQQSTPFERGKKTLTRRRSPCLENWKEEGRNFIVFLSNPYYLKDTKVFFSVSLSPFLDYFCPC